MNRFLFAISVSLLLAGEPWIFAQNSQFEIFKQHKFDLESVESLPFQPGMPRMIYKSDMSAVGAKERVVLGYLPYWEFANATLRFEYLTVLAYFSAEITSGGDFSNLHHIGTDELASVINAARANDCLAIFTITNFSDDSIHALLSSEANRANAIKNITDLVVDEGADGVNIDFESVGYEDRGNFLTFIKELKKSL
ncbi:MAG: hypothetical protein FJ088_14875, partial [Deltaproteobacteria bacterium]|nr:hypothetical protein [Deltaproteobacteria bacterium]